MSQGGVEIIFMVTRSVLLSEDPRNYALRLLPLLRSFGVNANFNIITNSFIALLKTLYYVIRRRVIVFPFTKGMNYLQYSYPYL